MDEKEKLTQIVKLVQKDIGQFELLYSYIINKVYFWCYTVIGNEADAKDVAQEAMIQIYKSIHSLRTPETFNSWMYRLVRNSCLNYIRLHKKKDYEFSHNERFNESFEDNIVEERSYNLPKESYDVSENKELIKSFVDKLPTKQREIITLYYLEELKTTEIAEILDYNIGSVRSRLHAGRKNLESQINDYQDKNNVKLYSTTVLPMLGLVLGEYRNEICNKQNLQYEKSLYNTGNPSLLGNLIEALSSKIAMIITTIVCISVIVVVVAAVFQNQPLEAMNDTDGNALLVDNSEIFSKSKVHPYIRDITYSGFPMRESVAITIELKKDVKEKDIKIQSNDEELSFEKNKKDVVVHVTENGIYTISINDYKTTFRISTIDIYAPEIVEVQKYENYLQIIVNDELSQIDYEKSFLEYQGEKYSIPKSLKINGNFNGIAKITIYHQSGDWIRYSFNLE